MKKQGKRKAQKFGGPWTLLKVEMVERYIQFFNKALKSTPFERVYIDAFAGSGAFHYVDIDAMPSHGIFGKVDKSKYIHAGSAQRALNVDPRFHTILFFERKKANVAELREIIAESKHPNARVEQGDANETLREVCNPKLWKNRRGVIFLDPFGMRVDWKTLEVIAKTKALDVWFLFSLGGLMRNLPGRFGKLDESKRSAVCRILGTEEWLDIFYKAPRVPPRALFGDPPEPEKVRIVDVDDVEAYVEQRLKKIFPHVESPRRLRSKTKAPLFSLFFALSNPNPKAIALAQKGARHILKGR